MPGVLREEAEVRVGGSAKLEACIARGAAKVIEKNGVEYIMFPKLEFGKMTTSSSSKGIEKQAKSTNEAFEAAEQVMDSLSWGIVSSQAALEVTDMLSAYICFSLQNRCVAHHEYIQSLPIVISSAAVHQCSSNLLHCDQFCSNSSRAS